MVPTSSLGFIIWVIFGIIVLALGGVAQGLEQSAHNRLVAGSKPAAPTIFYCSISAVMLSFS